MKKTYGNIGIDLGEGHKKTDFLCPFMREEGINEKGKTGRTEGKNCG